MTVANRRLKRLSAFEITDRIIRFNETNDRSVFDDVPLSQQVDIMNPLMYPEALAFIKERHEQERHSMEQENVVDQ